MLYADTSMATIPADEYQAVLHDLASRLTPLLRQQAYQVVISSLDYTWKPDLTAREWAYHAANHLRIEINRLVLDCQKPILIDPGTKLRLQHFADEFADRMHALTNCKKTANTILGLIETDSNCCGEEVLKVLLHHGYTVLEFRDAVSIMVEAIAHKDGWAP